jgi:hypothetical protein
LWALDSYTKLVFGPKGPYGIDWVTEFENGTYKHKTEHKHATLAITDTAVQRMTVCLWQHLIFNRRFIRLEVKDLIRSKHYLFLNKF